jgi:hypothetical protein
MDETETLLLSLVQLSNTANRTAQVLACQEMF